jgi:hypothetical protein
MNFATRLVRSPRCFFMAAVVTRAWMASREQALFVAIIEKNARVYLGTSFRRE